jgi:hypothetical protein
MGTSRLSGAGDLEVAAPIPTAAPSEAHATVKANIAKLFIMPTTLKDMQ